MTDAVTDGVAEGVAPSGPPLTCEVCGRAPAITIHASMYSGRVLFGDEIFWKGDACRQCATCQYRAGLTHCLWAGWWSPVALVVNPGMILRNVRGLRRARAMPAPEGAALAEPLDAGRPVLARPAAVAGLLVPILVVVLAIALIVTLLGPSGRIDDVAVGECLDLPSGRRIDRVDDVPCATAHDAEVTAVLSGTKLPSVDQLCVDETTAYLGSDRPVAGLAPSAIRFADDDQRVICLITSEVAGGRLVGSHRNAGR